MKISRRGFVSASAAAVAASQLKLSRHATQAVAAEAPPAPIDQPVFGYIGCGIRFYELLDAGCRFGPAGALCDVDMIQLGRGLQSVADRHGARNYSVAVPVFEDYRSLLDRKDIDAVVIATPDHWHTKIAIDAMRAGKHVYCEKPMTLTIAEGSQILKVVKETGRTFQVGTQQRTEFEQLFVRAAAIVREGRLGKIKKITCALGGALSSPAIPLAQPPKWLNWDAWLGQCPQTPYRATVEAGEQHGYGAGFPFSRTHNYFRWWYEYSGGKLTDWGAHHVDIAMWALDRSDASIGPFEIDPLAVSHPVPFKNGYPTQDDRFNTATTFHARVKFSDGVILDVRDEAEELGFGNGVMFEGEKGRIFVDRGRLTGKAVEDLASNPLPEDALQRLYGKTPPTSHMGDFVDCMQNGGKTASDPESHHAHLTVCHAINIAFRLNRKLTFDPAAQTFLNDAEAASFVAREQRKGYEIVA